MTRKTALVTGGSSGIGQGTAWVLAEKGYDIAISYHGEPEGADETRRGVEERGGRCFSFQANLGDPERAEYLVYQAIEALGHLDLMVCNAGINSRPDLLTITTEEMDEVWALNFRSYMLCASVASRHMVKEGIRGSIVFISSIRAQRAFPDDWLYGGLKAAVERACEGIALQLGPWGIRANCVAPGAIWVEEAHPTDEALASEHIPFMRMGKPTEIGAAVAWLASEEASYVTGAVVHVDGALMRPGIPEEETDSRWGQLKHPGNYLEEIQAWDEERLDAARAGLSDYKGYGGDDETSK